MHKRLRGGRYRTGNAIYELQFLGDLWSVEIKASQELARVAGKVIAVVLLVRSVALPA